MKTLNELVKEFLEENYHYTKKEDGNYHFEIYVDYRDEIEDSGATEILENNDPESALLEKLWDCYQESEWDIIDNLIDEFKEKVDPKDFEEARNNYKDPRYDEDEMIREEFMDAVYVDYPIDWARGQEYCFNIIVSNGDDNYDFWLNEHIVDEDGKIDMNAEKAGLVWLAKQQGHTFEEVVEILKKDPVERPKIFLETVQQEIDNGYGCEALTFCVKMTLRQAIELKEKMKSNPNGSIVLDKKTTCGLFDMWNGAGSVLDISCDKDIEIPFTNIWKFYIDERRTNSCDSIHNVYGVTDAFWKDYLKEIKD